jgi:hypothetical protein
MFAFPSSQSAHPNAPRDKRHGDHNAKFSLHAVTELACLTRPSATNLFVDDEFLGSSLVLLAVPLRQTLR